MLIDDVTLKITAGNGGKGKVAFNKNLMELGPVGGSGGKGGSVYFEGTSDLNALNKFRFKKNVDADNGEDGKAQFNDGADAKDLILTVPVGTVIHDLENNVDYEIVKIGERIMIAKGGKGGRGNFHFRSATNTTPKQFQSGIPGGEAKVRLELKLIADVGFVGLPNVGKSSLLNELTRASAKVANYPFTTLEPNLGTHFELILADIPGLIEGASIGKGLGIKFLRHVERTTTLFHFVSAESADPALDYKTIRKELGEYNKELLKRKEYVFISKSDEVKVEDLNKMLKAMKKLNPNTIAISIYDDESIKEVAKILNIITKEKHIA
ncbi:MAG: GTPase ObgE [Candidatus Jorgensenbacteria bacterium]|nr:GTPase ObgE [Candidatus Jorgensenbacteria bacterium]